MTKNIFTPGPNLKSVCGENGEAIPIPDGWALLPPGDAALTRRVKSAGDHFVVQEKIGRRIFSKGVWADASTIERIKIELIAERSTPAHVNRKQNDAKRRLKAQSEYVEDFNAAVIAYLAFNSAHSELANKIAKAVTDHSTPVGSGTVARTKTIPIEKRAQAAVIAWMRHQTTAYDSMEIPKIKGKRREIRRMLAKQSHIILARYRRNEFTEGNCVLVESLQKIVDQKSNIP